LLISAGTVRLRMRTLATEVITSEILPDEAGSKIRGIFDDLETSWNPVEGAK